MITTKATTTENYSATDDRHSFAHNSTDRIISKSYNMWSNGIKYGVVASVLVGAYQVFLSLTESGIHIGYGLVGLFLMTPVIWYALREYAN